jgi:hypothetical protein
MSADNGIYILVTPFPHFDLGLTKQYRVVHCQNIEDIYWDTKVSRHVEEIQPEMLREKFGNVEPFTNEAAARGRAFEMAQEIYDEGLPLEYGIREIAYDKPFPT